MTCLRVLPIVEGHGDVASVRLLLQRVWVELLEQDYCEVLRPIRVPRSRIVQHADLENAVLLARRKLCAARTSDSAALILILIDADSDAPCLLGPELLNVAKATAPDYHVCCILANKEYETWFVASAMSLIEYISVASEEDVPPSPEDARSGKGWLEERFRGTKYSPTVDQPRLTSAMNLNMCRARSPSFDKLCRDLERIAACLNASPS
jgi:hypothetical protein